MKYFENYFEKNNYTISNMRLSDMRGMFSDDNICQ